MITSGFCVFVDCCETAESLDGAKKSFFKGGKRSGFGGRTNVWSAQLRRATLLLSAFEGWHETAGGSFCCCAPNAFKKKKATIVRARRNEDIKNPWKAKYFFRISTKNNNAAPIRLAR